MGYAKVVQFGNQMEIYEYEKFISNTKRRPLSNLQKKRMAERRKINIRSAFSVRRSVSNFFRLAHHNNHSADTVCFLTLTFIVDLDYKVASRYVADFFQRLKKTKKCLSISYISVPERTKRGRWHFHVLVYNLPPFVSCQSKEYEGVIIERETRNFQRLFRRGYVDIMLATTITTGIAGYMAKYMAKSFRDGSNEGRRGYNCSRNIKKIYSAGSNFLTGYMDMILGVDNQLSQSAEYDTVWLGRCHYKKYLKI